MSEKSINLIMTMMVAIGLVLIFSGIGLIFLTDIHLKYGAEGVLLIAGIIGAGLFLSFPAKIYLILQQMKRKDEMLKTGKKVY
jgi:hypothetical protein